MSYEKQQIIEENDDSRQDCQSRNVQLISCDNQYQPICITKLSNAPDDLEVSPTLSLCTASLRVAERQISMILLDQTSSNEKKHISIYEDTVESLSENFEISEDDRMCIEYVTFCDKWGHYTGVSEKPFFPNKNDTKEQAQKRYEMERAADSKDTKPLVLLGSINEFVRRNYSPDEVKLVIEQKHADELFGYTSDPVLWGLKESDLQKYWEFKNTLEEGQAFCRQTTARIYGTNSPSDNYDGQPMELGFAAICNGARVRTIISLEQGEIDNFLDPEKVYVVSFSGIKFEQLFGSLKDLKVSIREQIC